MIRASGWDLVTGVLHSLSSRGEAGKNRSILVLLCSVVGLFAAPEAALGAPRAVIRPAASCISVEGDCNVPAVWVNGELRLYESPYPHDNFMGGVASYASGSSVTTLTQKAAVTPDRCALAAYTPAAFGPWFESIIADDAGVLWAYYHAEFPNPEQTKVHPRIGAQVSRDNGATWTDLGVLLDTPADTDEMHSWLGYGFSGGNGDCSAILDADKKYVYFFYSQYGATPGTQGIAVARMLWADRAQPVGKVMKWYDGSWAQPGLGGEATPILANLGDAHGMRSGFDFWWGPSIHWNTHLQRYVILMNRSNSGDFTFNSGVANWYMSSPTLEDPSQWDTPEALPFQDGYLGSWYPQVIGLGNGDTDTQAGRTARLFVSGTSQWEITFLREDEEFAPAVSVDPAVSVANSLPSLTIAIDGLATDSSVPLGTVVTLRGEATDVNGDMAGHWLEVQRPDGVWSWEGWLLDAPWDGTLGGTGYLSKKSAEITLDAPGTYTLRSSAIDSSGCWVVSAEIHLFVGTKPLPRMQVTVECAAAESEVSVGSTLSISGTALDCRGETQGHWIEIRNPGGQWNWEGWLVDGPWGGELGGDGYTSTKSATLSLDQPGDYIVRSTACYPGGVWVISSELKIHVVDTQKNDPMEIIAIPPIEVATL